jgi:hypothetical protein
LYALPEYLVFFLSEELLDEDDLLREEVLESFEGLLPLDDNEPE